MQPPSTNAPTAIGRILLVPPEAAIPPAAEDCEARTWTQGRQRPHARFPVEMFVACHVVPCELCTASELIRGLGSRPLAPSPSFRQVQYRVPAPQILVADPSGNGQGFIEVRLGLAPADAKHRSGDTDIVRCFRRGIRTLGLRQRERLLREFQRDWSCFLLPSSVPCHCCHCARIKRLLQAIDPRTPDRPCSPDRWHPSDSERRTR